MTFMRLTPLTSERTRGFTLIEMMVSVALFAVVMTVCIDVLLSLVNANRKAQALQSVMNNLNIALDGMVRAVREGSVYHCGPGGGQNMSTQDCSSAPSTIFAFEPHGQDATGNPWVYSLQNGQIYRSENGQIAIPITAPEVSISSLSFYVVGSTPGDSLQPEVLIVVEGAAGAPGTSAQTTFHIEATAVQRQLDL